MQAPIQKILIADSGRAHGEFYIQILQMQTLFPGVVPSESSLLLHAALFNHYEEGAYYIRGGSSEIPYQIVQRLEALGGKVLVKAPVQKILTNDQGQAVGK